VGQYNVVIVNRHLSQCHHPLLGQQHPAPCLPAWPSELSRSSLVSAACGLLYSAVNPVAIYTPSMTHHVSSGHTADGVLTACQSRDGVGGRLIRGC